MLAPDYIPEDSNELDSGTPDSNMCAAHHIKDFPNEHLTVYLTIMLQYNSKRSYKVVTIFEHNYYYFEHNWLF